MHFDIALGGDLPEALEGARAAEDSGFAAGWMPENKHDALIHLAVVSRRTASNADRFKRGGRVRAKSDGYRHCR